eukprot:COSAG04_NODE_1532_length_6439_cov_1.468139_7_plen_154_part_00
MVAALSASLVVNAMPVGLQTISWVPISEVAKGIADAVLRNDDGGRPRVTHHSQRVPMARLWPALLRIIGQKGDGPPKELQAVDWVSRIREGEAQLAAMLRPTVAALLAAPSGLEGAIGLCENPLMVAGGDGMASPGAEESVVAAVAQALFPNE